MGTRWWWLLAATVPALGACAAAVLAPHGLALADLVLLVGGPACCAAVWAVGGRSERGARGWRLLALSPLFPVLGALAGVIVAPADPVDLLVLRWVPTVPGYLLAIVGGLTLVHPDRFRARGRRIALEFALFATATMVAVQALVVGPAGRWGDLAGPVRLVLGAGVLATSLTMAAALTVLCVVEARRRPAAWLLLGGAGTLAVGRALMTSAVLDGTAVEGAVGRLLVVAGLAFVVAAALADPGRDIGRDRVLGALVERTGSTSPGDQLPHLAMLAAMAVLAGILLGGSRPNVPTVLGVLACVALAAAHRWVSAREEQRLSTRLAQSEARFRSLVNSGSDAVVVLDDALRVSWASPALHRALGAAADDLIGRSLTACVHPEDVPALTAALAAATAADATTGSADAGQDAPGLLPLRLADAAGRWRVLEAGLSDLRCDPHVGGVVLQCRDVTDRHVREQTLRGVAYTDPVSGLPNRAGCLLALERELARTDRPVSLLLVELDGLLEAREQMGREVAGALVAEVGRRLRATVRAEDVVARLGGGAFAVLAHGAVGDAAGTHDAEVDQLAARCLAVVEQPIAAADGLVDLTASLGIATASEPGMSVEDVLTRVHLAVRAARQRATGTAARWTPAMGEAAQRRDGLRRALEGARQRGELFVLVEPVVSLSEHRVVGIEALLRWRHPEFGDVPPAEFLPLADHAGLTADLHRWLLREAMAIAVAVPGPAEPIRLGVNISPGAVGAGTLVADVEAALRETGMAAQRLVLEIDEPAIMTDDERVALDLRTLRLMGVHVALQGFGTGYSALTQLTRLPFDVLKLDRTLVARIDRDAQSRALCASVVGIGRSLGLDVVAEGVETSAQLSALQLAGCGFAQGFLVSRPMPPSGLEDLLAAGVATRWSGMVGAR